MSSFFPYSQPSLPDLLIIASFIYLLNVVRIAADLALHAGIVAELFLGMVYGSPLAGILPWSWETTFIVMGYLGLVLIVFEGEFANYIFANQAVRCLKMLTSTTRWALEQLTCSPIQPTAVLPMRSDWDRITTRPLFCLSESQVRLRSVGGVRCWCSVVLHESRYHTGGPQQCRS